MSRGNLIYPGGRACIVKSGYSESFDPSVLRTEMENGPPKERLMNTQVLMKIKASLLFRSEATQLAFENWYFNVIKRIGYFDLTHPRTGQPLIVRFENGSIGELTTVDSRFRHSMRNVVFEYLR